MTLDEIFDEIREQFSANHSHTEATMPEAAYLATYRIHMAQEEKDHLTRRKNMLQAIGWLIKALMVMD